MKTKKLMKNLAKTATVLNKFMLNVRKEFLTMLNKLAKIWGFATATSMACTSCGTVVKAAVTQPKDTAKTTITISTNTPVKTQVDPNTNVEFNKEKH